MSAGGSPSVPVHPEAAGGSALDRGLTDPDDDLLRALAREVGAADPVPATVVADAREALAWHAVARALAATPAPDAAAGPRRGRTRRGLLGRLRSLRRFGRR